LRAEGYREARERTELNPDADVESFVPDVGEAAPVVGIEKWKSSPIPRSLKRELREGSQKLLIPQMKRRLILITALFIVPLGALSD